MHILSIGEKRKQVELANIVEINVKVTAVTSPASMPEHLNKFDLIIDLDFDMRDKIFRGYYNLDGKPVIVGAVNRQLAELIHLNREGVSCLLIGMNTLPTMIERTKLEWSFLDEAARTVGLKLQKAFKPQIIEVGDRVGMVTPRVIAMIINEACFTLQEGTANIKDIDTAMKLGTNYPYGPFQWADLIGVQNIYHLLENLYQDTHEERFKVCPLLKTKYLKKESFY